MSALLDLRAHGGHISALPSEPIMELGIGQGLLLDQAAPQREVIRSIPEPG